MRNSRLLELLDTLELRELKSLKKWIASPFFNQRQDVIDLFDLYLKYKKRGKDFPDKESVFKQLFPKQTYDDHKVRLAMSFLNRLVERFLVFQENEKKEATKKLTLAKVFKEKNLDKHYLQTIKETKSIIQKSEKRNAEYYRLIYDLKTNELEYNVHNKRTQNIGIQEVLDDLDAYYLLEKFNYSTTAISHQKVYTTKYDLGFLPYILKEKDNIKSIKNNPAINTFHACHLSILDTENSDYYFAFKKLLFKNAKLFSDKELIYFHLGAAISCTSRHNRGEERFTLEVQEIHEHAIQLGVYKNLNQFIFRNVVTFGLHNKKYQWVEDFINEYGPRLKTKHQDAMIAWTRASLAYKRKEYKKALTFLQEAKFEDLLHNLYAKITMMKIYFETNEIEVLQSHLKAMETFTRRHPQIGYHQQLTLDMILFMRKIITLNPYDKTAKGKLRKEIEAINNIGWKKWLLECIEE